ncbi:MAG: DUF2029 domain-containing protein [Proteobacteria bacterium]|nr:DUF2029 domain-containing protein [Pseudomonadota bacterium]
MNLITYHKNGNGVAPGSGFPYKLLVKGLAIIFVLIVGGIALLPTQVIRRGLHTWNLYHYVIGTKYFDELGYFDLYTGTLAADADRAVSSKSQNTETGRLFSAVTQTRDLHTYKVIPVQSAIERARKIKLRDRFSPSRWEQFTSDLEMIRKQRPDPKYWRGPLRDRGFNPSPAWLLVHKPLLNSFDLKKHEGILFFLCYAQNLLFFATFVAVFWAFGKTASLLFAALFLLYFGNWVRYAGGYFSYDWFITAVWAVVLYRKRRFLPSGVLLAYAGLMRGFPILLALYPALAWLARIARGKRPRRYHTLFLASVTAGVLVIFGLTCIPKNGLDSWRQWREKISVHAHHHTISSNRVGLQMLFVNDYSSNPSRPSVSKRHTIVEKQAPAYRAVASVLILLALVAMIRRREHNGVLLGLAVIFFGFMLSRYYFSLWALLATWSLLGSQRVVQRYGMIWLFVIFGAATVLWALPTVSVRTQYTVFNAGVTLYFVVLIGFFLAKDARWFYVTRLRKRAGGPHV